MESFIYFLIGLAVLIVCLLIGGVMRAGRAERKAEKDGTIKNLLDDQ